eukprot:6479444-Amphidinium_carterae.2
MQQLSRNLLGLHRLLTEEGCEKSSIPVEEPNVAPGVFRHPWLPGPRRQRLCRVNDLGKFSNHTRDVISRLFKTVPRQNSSVLDASQGNVSMLITDKAHLCLWPQPLLGHMGNRKNKGRTNRSVVSGRFEIEQPPIQGTGPAQRQQGVVVHNDEINLV